MKRVGRPGPPPEAKRTIKIDIQYQGTNYVGWQRQAKGKSVQGLVEGALSKIANEKITLFSASRTDAGVHALQQVASFSLQKSKTPSQAFVEGTNTLLPEDIRILQAEEMDLHFFAPEAKEKTYRYFIQTGAIPLVFIRAYAWHIPSRFNHPLRLSAMDEGSRQLLGTYDFSAFRSGAATTQTSVRTVLNVKWGEGPLGLIYFEVTAEGFLKYMVRNIVGTLVEVGQGKRKPEDVRLILESKQRSKAGPTAPPNGLFLWSVTY